MEHLNNQLQEDQFEIKPCNASPYQVYPPCSPCNMFLTGYMDCAQEALWYLTVVEKLPWDHPMVVGLKMHLYEQYRILQLQYLLGNSMRMCNETGSGNSSGKNMATDVNTNENIVTDSDDRTSVNHKLLTDMSVDNTGISSAISKHCDSEIRHTAVVSEPELDTDLSPRANQLAEALAEEIYALIQAQSDTDDTEVEDEDESIDEGFDEVIQTHVTE